MPLPNGGGGETLTGAPAAADPSTGKPAPPVTTPGLPSPDTLLGVSPQARRAEPRPPAEGQQTLFGVAPEVLRGALPPAGAPPQQTLLGVAPSKNAPLAQPPAAPAVQKTLLGVIPEDVAKAVEAAQNASRAGSAAAPAPFGSAPAGQRTLLGAMGPGGFEPVRNASTLLGAASSAQMPRAADSAQSPEAAEAPAFAATEQAARAPGGFPVASAAPPAGDPPPPAPEPLHAKTHLGVAVPGIAPLRAGVAPEPAPATRLEAAEAEPSPASTGRAQGPLDATQLPHSSLTGSLVIPPRLQLTRGALVFLGSAIVLLGAAVAFALLWQGSKPLSAMPSTDASGKERIDIVCESCPDGTKVSLGAASAEFDQRKAYLEPGSPLPLGESELTFQLQKPGEGVEEVKVAMPPLEYRIRPDTSTLIGDQPRLTLEIDAIVGTRVVLAGQAVSLDDAGHGELALDVSAQLTGPASDVTSFEQSVSYAIVPPSGKEHTGNLAVKIGVTPLLLEAPGSDIVTDLPRFMLAGRTTKGAEISVAGNALPVDASGRFAQLMSIDSVGEIKVVVRATEPGLAPRFVPFKLQRVANLAAHAETLRPGALPLASVVSDVAAHRGKRVWVKGKIADVRVDGHRSLVLVEAQGDCGGRTCLARLNYGGLRKLERGRAVTAIGTLLGAAGAAGSAAVPELEVSLLL